MGTQKFQVALAGVVLQVLVAAGFDQGGEDIAQAVAALVTAVLVWRVRNQPAR